MDPHNRKQVNVAFVVGLVSGACFGAAATLIVAAPQHPQAAISPAPLHTCRADLMSTQSALKHQQTVNGILADRCDSDNG